MVRADRAPGEHAAAQAASDRRAQAAADPAPTAKRLQDELDHAYDRRRRRWSARRTLAFIVIVCGGFWAAVAVIMHRLLS